MLDGTMKKLTDLDTVKQTVYRGKREYVRNFHETIFRAYGTHQALTLTDLPLIAQ
jgi:hypothetical protein